MLRLRRLAGRRRGRRHVLVLRRLPGAGGGGEAIGGAPEGSALLLHDHVATDRQGDELDQPQEDAEFAAHVDFDRGFAEGGHARAG